MSILKITLQANAIARQQERDANYEKSRFWEERRKRGTFQHDLVLAEARHVAAQLRKEAAERQAEADYQQRRAGALRTQNVYSLVSVFYERPRDVAVARALDSALYTMNYREGSDLDYLHIAAFEIHDAESWIAQPGEALSWKKLPSEFINQQVEKAIAGLPSESKVYKELDAAFAARKPRKSRK